MSSEKADVSKTFDVLDPRVQCLTPLSDNDEDHCLVTGAVPAGVVVLLHSHTDLGGEVPGFGRIAGAYLALAMYSMCLVVSGTRGETHLACPRRCCWCALCRFLRDTVASGAPAAS